jgi:hypothetical protein
MDWRSPLADAEAARRETMLENVVRISGAKFGNLFLHSWMTSSPKPINARIRRHRLQRQYEAALAPVQAASRVMSMNSFDYQGGHARPSAPTGRDGNRAGRLGR